MKPIEFLEAGAKLLAPKLEPVGFRFAITAIGQGSGGSFAEGAFTSGKQQICLWVRHRKLGGVTYRVGAAEWSHSDYMRALGRSSVAHYPGFDDGDPSGGFRRLLSDLDYCAEFLNGDGGSVADLVLAAPPHRKGIKGLSAIGRIKDARHY